MDQSFVPFDASHLSALAATFGTSLILVAIAWAWPSLAATIRFTLAAVLLATWALRFILLYDRGSFSVATTLPMYLCDWATVVVTISLLRPNQRTYDLAYFWGLGGTLQALLTPDLAIDFPDLQFVIFFILHGGVIVSVLFLTLGLRMRPWPASVPRVVVWSFVYLAAAIAVNAVFGTNFSYLRAKPLQPSLLDFLSPWPCYIAEMLPLGGVFIILLYSPFFVQDWSVSRRNISSDRQ